MKKILLILALMMAVGAFAADPRVGGVDVVPRTDFSAYTNAANARINLKAPLEFATSAWSFAASGSGTAADPFRGVEGRINFQPYTKYNWGGFHYAITNTLRLGHEKSEHYGGGATLQFQAVGLSNCVEFISTNVYGSQAIFNGFNIDGGTNAAGAAAYGIYVWSFNQGSHFDNNSVRNVRRAGLLVGFSVLATFDNFLCSGNIDFNTNSNAGAAWIVKPTNGVYMTEAFSCFFRNLIAERLPGYGIFALTANMCEISGTSEGNGGGIYLGPGGSANRVSLAMEVNTNPSITESPGSLIHGGYNTDAWVVSNTAPGTVFLNNYSGIIDNRAPSTVVIGGFYTYLTNVYNIIGHYGYSPDNSRILGPLAVKTMALGDTIGVGGGSIDTGWLGLQDTGAPEPYLRAIAGYDFHFKRDMTDAMIIDQAGTIFFGTNKTTGSSVSNYQGTLYLRGTNGAPLLTLDGRTQRVGLLTTAPQATLDLGDGTAEFALDGNNNLKIVDRRIYDAAQNNMHFGSLGGMITHVDGVTVNINTASGAVLAATGSTLTAAFLPTNAAPVAFLAVNGGGDIAETAIPVGEVTTAQLNIAASNRVVVAAGTGGITVTPSGSGGVMTFTVNDDDAGGGSQTPWSSNIEGAGYNLTNVGILTVNGVLNFGQGGQITGLSNYLVNAAETNGASSIVSFLSYADADRSAVRQSAYRITLDTTNSVEEYTRVTGGTSIANSLTNKLTADGWQLTDIRGTGQVNFQIDTKRGFEFLSFMTNWFRLTNGNASFSGTVTAGTQQGAHKSADGTLGVSENAGGGTFKDGLLTAGTPYTGSGAGVLSNTPTLYGATLLGPTTFQEMYAGRLIALSNRTDVAEDAIPFLNGNTFESYFLTNALTANRSAYLTNYYDPTNHRSLFLYAVGGASDYSITFYPQPGHLLRTNQNSTLLTSAALTIPANQVAEWMLSLFTINGTNGMHVTRLNPLLASGGSTVLGSFGASNIVSFGAVAGADSTAAIQALLTAGVPHIYVPQGVFTASNLVITKPLILEGPGTLKLPNSIAQEVPLLHITNAYNVRIRDVTLDGNVFGTATWTEWNHSIIVAGSRNVIIQGVNFTNIFGDGVYVTMRGDGKPSEVVSIINSRFLGSDTRTNRNGVSLVSGTDITIADNYFYGMAQSVGPMPGAIDIEPNYVTQTVQRVSIRGNFITNCYQGVQLYNPVQANVGNISITENVIVKPIAEGMFISGAGSVPYGLVITGNRIVDFGNNTGIQMVNVDGSFVSGNIIIGNHASAIGISGDSASDFNFGQNMFDGTLASHYSGLDANNNFTDSSAGTTGQILTMRGNGTAGYSNAPSGGTILSNAVVTIGLTNTFAYSLGTTTNPHPVKAYTQTDTSILAWDGSSLTVTCLVAGQLTASGNFWVGGLSTTKATARMTLWKNGVYAGFMGGTRLGALATGIDEEDFHGFASVPVAAGDVMEIRGYCSQGTSFDAAEAYTVPYFYFTLTR